MAFASYGYQAIRHSPLSITRTPPLLLCVLTLGTGTDTTLLIRYYLHYLSRRQPLHSKRGNPGIIDLVVSTMT